MHPVLAGGGTALLQRDHRARRAGTRRGRARWRQAVSTSPTASHRRPPPSERDRSERVNDVQPQDHRGVPRERRTRRRAAGGHADPAPAPHRRQVRDRARHAAGLQPPRRRPLRDRRLQRRIRRPTRAGTTTSRRIPAVEVEVGAETFIVRAEELEGAARDALWSRLVAASPSLTEYQAKAGRRIPMFALRPLLESSPPTVRVAAGRCPLAPAAHVSSTISVFVPVDRCRCAAAGRSPASGRAMSRTRIQDEGVGVAGRS